MDRNWRFALGHAVNPALDFEFVRSRCLVKAGEARGAAGTAFDDKKWRNLDLPHDWAIELPLDPKGDKELAEHGFYAIGPDHPEHSVGWYRRHFNIPKSDLGRRISVEFDGVFRDSIVWVNGHRMGRHQSGYTGFRYDITDVVNYGGANVIAVRVDASSWEGWWYEGAGIYRHVWLVKTDPLHIPQHGTFVTSEVSKGKAFVTVRTTIVNESDEPAVFNLESQISGLKSQKSKRTKLDPFESTEIVQQIAIKSPRLWSCEEPNLYHLESTLHIAPGEKKARVPFSGNQKKETRAFFGVVDRFETTFGIRTLKWDAKLGFFLNGKPVKIKGTCNHRDHAGVGAALPDRLHVLRVEKLKEFGSNAFRMSHYAHATEVLDACDRLGMLVMAENRLAGSNPEVLGQFEAMIRRDRNHPSIILWSLANEEHTVQWSIAGERIGKSMVRLAHHLDPTRKVTAAMHDKGLDVGFANIVDVHGWNYMKVGNIEKFHKRRPDQPMVGSEEASTVCTRGIYSDIPSLGYVSAYDIRSPGWGTTAEKWWTYFAERPWLAGAFVWTGFDYRGEPIPYKWPCTTSHFGLMDLCGFPKDNYYYYKSWWQREPVLHLFPHWNWPGREGQSIDVRVFSNCDEVELLHNDRSLGRQKMNVNSHLAWKVIYEPGTLEAYGYRDGQVIASAQVETTGAPAKLVLTPDRATINADGEDVSSVTVSVVDAQGRSVPTADNLIHFELTGPGKLLGVGNGDPSSHESDLAPHRRLFSGLGLALVQSTQKPGTVQLIAKSDGLIEARSMIQAAKCPLRSALA